MNYMKQVKEFFWSNLEDDELQVIDDNHDIIEQAIRLMEIEDESITNQEIESSSNLKSLFGFNNCEILNVINDFSSVSSGENLYDSVTDYSEEEDFLENFRMNNQETPKKEVGESFGTKEPEESGNMKRKGNFYPTTENRNTTNIFGTDILNIDCKPNMKEHIDKWAQEISLIIQTNSEAYDDQKTILLLVEHKTTCVVNSMIKYITWAPKMSHILAFEDILDAIYTMFLGIDLSANKT